MAPKKGKKQHGKGKPGALKAKGRETKKKKDKKSGAKKDGKKSKLASGLGNLLKAGGKKMQAKMKSQGAKLEEKMKKKGVEMRQKMKAKGNELRKKMKDKVHEKSEEMKKKMKGTRAGMKKKMRDKSHELKAKMEKGGREMKAKMKAKGKELQADAKKKMRETGKRMKETGEKMKHSGEELEKEMANLGGEAASGITNKLVAWRKTFEDKGWAIGKVQDDWFSLMLLGLNAFSAGLAIPVLGVSISLASAFKRECLAFLLTPAVTIGFLFSLLLLGISLAGFAGVWWNRLGIVKIHFFLTAVLVVMLLCFTLFGFAVTYRGGGKKLPGIAFRRYRFTDYSKWLQRKLVGNGSHWQDIRSCVAKGSFCRNWNLGSAEEVYSAKLSSTQSGCCAPPFPCGFAYQGGTNWRLPSTPDAEADCSVWNANELCLDCDSCKAGILQNVKSKWYKASVVNIVVIAALLAILYRTWFVMRVSGRWESVAQEVKQAVKPKEEEQEHVEPSAVIDIILEGEEHDETAKKRAAALVEEDEDTLFPSWLEEDTPADSIPKSSSATSSQASSTSKRSKKGKGKKSPPSETSSDAGSKKSRKQKGKGKATAEDGQASAQDDDSWASPRQQAESAVGTFPQGFVAQNPLAAMSPWMQSPQAGYMQSGALYNDPNYMQAAYLQGQIPGDYTFYQTDPYGQMAGNLYQGYQDPQMQMYMQDPQMQQMYMQDPMQQMYMQDPQMQQMYMQDPQMQSYGFYQDPYVQDPNQGYQYQAYDPSQAYMQDPNQAYQGWQNPSY